MNIDLNALKKSPSLCLVEILSKNLNLLMTDLTDEKLIIHEQFN
jgi:hypothetical protein